MTSRELQPAIEAVPDDIARLLRTAGDRLVRLAGVLGANDPENTVAEAIARVYATADPRRLTVPYLRTAVVNGVRDEHRRRDVATRHAPVVAAPQEADDHAADVALNRTVAEAMSLLPRSTREALILRYWADFSLREVAHTLGVPLGTAKTLIARGRCALRPTLEEITREN